MSATFPISRITNALIVDRPLGLAATSSASTARVDMASPFFAFNY
jgi:hypothetical protein